MVEYRKKLMSSLFKLSKVQCPPLIMYQRLSPTPFKKATTVAYLFLPTTIVIYISALILRCQFPTKQSLPCPTQKKKKRRKDKAVIVSMHYFIASLTEKTTLASWFTKEHLNNSVINAYDLFYYKICIDSCSKKKKQKKICIDSVSEYIYIYIYMAMKIERSVIVQRGFEYLTTIEIPFFYKWVWKRGIPFYNKDRNHLHRRKFKNYNDLQDCFWYVVITNQEKVTFWFYIM